MSAGSTNGAPRIKRAAIQVAPGKAAERREKERRNARVQR